MDTLSGYPLDRDYLNVDNWDPSSSLAKEQQITVDETDSSISAEAADGALSASEVEQDFTNITVNDGRSITRTTFWPSDVATKYSHSRNNLKRLASLNDGARASDRPRQNSVADKNRLIDIFCGHCGVPYSERINYLYDHIDMSRKGTYGFEHIILAIMSLVCQSNGRFIRNESDFIELLDTANMNHSDLRSCKDLCREHFERAGVEI